MMRVFRLLQTVQSLHGVDGEGARLYGGRWNSIGTPMVYCAQSLSLAVLEVMVHAGDHFLRGNPYSFLMIELSESLVTNPDPASLPESWSAADVHDSSRVYGDAWVEQKTSVALRVPSVIVPGEWNYLLNPAHPDFKKIKVGKAEPFALDKRLKKK